MLSFMKAGGYAMWFILALGGTTVVNAILYSRHPDDARMAVIRTLSLATLFASLNGFAVGVGTTLHYVAKNPGSPGDAPLLVMQGISESLSNIALGFSLLVITWLLAAVGARRVE